MGTQTLEEGRCSQDVPSRIMVTKHDKAAHCRNDCPFLLESHVIQSLSWCSHCDPNDALEKRAWVMRTSVEPQSVLYQSAISRILGPMLYTRLPFCTHS